MYKLNVSLSVILTEEHDAQAMTVIQNNIKRAITDAIVAEDINVDYDEVMDAVEISQEPIIEE